MEDEFISKYKPLEKIGAPGQFGFAKKCINIETGELCAVKIIHKRKFLNLKQSKNFYEQLRNEISIMQKIQHPNIVNFIGHFESKDKFYIVMELCEGGELFDRITAKGCYSEKDASKVLMQIAQGLFYLHSKDIAHLDLKPDNFLFLEKSEESPLKIIDFGMSRIVEKHRYLKTLAGTPYYVAPEVLDKKYNKSCDIWSFGVIMFVLLFGFPPFYAPPDDFNCEKKIFEQIKKGFQPVTKEKYGPWFPDFVKCSDSAKQLMSLMLEKDPVKRYSAKEVLNHPWMRGVTASDQKLDDSVVERLISFKKTCKLKEGFLNLVVNQLSDDELKDLKKEFDEVDLNKNGRISLWELENVFGNLKTKDKSSEKIKKLMESLDIDNDGNVSYKEWCMIAANKKLLDKEERLMKLFEELDLDGNGKLSETEIRQAMKKAKIDVDVEKAFREVDTNSDGEIDYNEFLAAFMNDSE